MKNGLRGTTAHGVLCAVLGGTLALPVAGAADAKIDVSVNGFARSQIGFADNQTDRPAVGGRTDVDIKTNNEIHFNAKTTLDNGIKLRAKIELEAKGCCGDVIDEQYIQINGNFGQLVLGSENSAAYQMQFRPRSAGLDSTSVEEWVVEISGASGSGDSAIEDVRLRFEDNDADKITYYTPRLAGLQLGVSYIPNTEQDRGGSQASIDEVYGNGAAVGINYRRKFGGMSIGLAAGYTTWFNQPSGHPGDNPEGWSAGAQFGVAGFTLSGAWMDINNLFDGPADPTDDAQDGHSYAVGLMYKTGPNTFSANYHHGEVEGKTSIPGMDESDLIDISARRQLGPGVRLSLTGFWADWQGEQVGNVDDNDGWAVVTEIRLDF